jgi:hypothetical protein
MKHPALLLSLLILISHSAFATETEVSMDAAKAYSELESLKAKHIQNLFKDPQGLEPSVSAVKSLAANYQNGDEAIIKFQYDKDMNLDVNKFPLPDDLIEHENKAFSLLQEEAKATTPKLRKQFEKQALEEIEKIKELKKQLMNAPAGTTFTTTIKLGNFGPADRNMKYALGNLHAKGLKIVSVERLPAAQVTIKNRLLRVIGKGGLKKGLGGVLAAGAISATAVVDAAAATKAENISYKPALQEFQNNDAGAK